MFLVIGHWSFLSRFALPLVRNFRTYYQFLSEDASKAVERSAPARLSRLRRAMGFALPYRGAVTGILLITLALAAVNAAEPLIFKYVFDGLASSPQARVLLIGIASLLGLGVFREVASAFTNWLTWQTRLSIHYTLLETVVERLHRMPLSFHRHEGVGAIMTKLDRGIQGFITALSQILFNVFPAVLYLAISVVIMFKLDWRLSVMVLYFAPLPALIAAVGGPGQPR